MESWETVFREFPPFGLTSDDEETYTKAIKGHMNSLERVVSEHADLITSQAELLLAVC